MRTRGWAESINLNIMIINNINDHVVDSNKTKIMKKRLKNSSMIEFNETKHEIFMEKDEHREVMWKAIDTFLK